jgi:DtxR family Mn-dependent transcriptional regulator
MADETSGLSRSVEDYLKVIYALSESGEVASTSAIAEVLEVQPASVTGMVKRLAELGYLEHIPYRGVQLTEAGSREALRVLRRHRILETYLAERLGYPWEEVHREAEQLEHAASERLIERMAEALENPSHDPHGAPIPTPTGEIEATDSHTLAELGAGDRGYIRAVRDDDQAGLRAAGDAGLFPGTSFTVVSRTFSPPVFSVEIHGAEGRTLDIGLDVALRIYVVPSPPESINPWAE